MVKFRSCALALVCLVMLAAAASGQQRQGYRTRQVQPAQRQPAQTQYGQQPQYRQPAQQRTTDRTYSAATDEYGRPRANTANSADRKIALLIANCNKAEVKLARYALNRAESSEVRTFADSLQQDHDITLRQLRRFAPEIGGSDSSDVTRGYEPEQRRSGDGRTARAWDDAAVAQQVSDRLVRKARDELSEKEGWEFDHCFVGQQLVAHQQDIAKMEVYRQYASPELRQVIDETIQIAEGHEQEARELATELRRGQGSEEREEYADSRERRRERYNRDETDSGDEGRVERASYQERSRYNRDDDDRDDDDRSYRDRSRDDADDNDRDEMEDDDDQDSDRTGSEREDEDDDDEAEDDDDDREERFDRSERNLRDRDR